MLHLVETQTILFRPKVQIAHAPYHSSGSFSLCLPCTRAGHGRLSLGFGNKSASVILCTTGVFYPARFLVNCHHKPCFGTYLSFMVPMDQATRPRNLHLHVFNHLRVRQLQYLVHLSPVHLQPLKLFSRISSILSSRPPHVYFLHSRGPWSAARCFFSFRPSPGGLPSCA